jgi:hypothetical protein
LRTFAGGTIDRGASRRPTIKKWNRVAGPWILRAINMLTPLPERRFRLRNFQACTLVAFSDDENRSDKYLFFLNRPNARRDKIETPE